MKPIAIILLLLSTLSCSSKALDNSFQDRLNSYYKKRTTQPVSLSSLVQYESLLPSVYQKPKAELVDELQPLASTYPRLLEIQQHTELLETHQFAALNQLIQEQEEHLRNSPSKEAKSRLQQLYFTFTVSSARFSKHFEAWIQHDPHNPVPWVARGLHRRIQGKRVRDHNATHETALARLNASKAFTQAAEQDLLHAISIDPHHWVAHTYLISVISSLHLNAEPKQVPTQMQARSRKQHMSKYKSIEEAYQARSEWVASKGNRIPDLLETIDEMDGYEQECVGLSSFLLLRGIPHDLSPRAQCLYKQQKYTEAKEVLEEIIATSSAHNQWAIKQLQEVSEQLNGG